MPLGLVLTGGGARGAWQAGALRALAHLLPGPFPFPVLAGASAGALNTTWLAAHLHNPGAAADGLVSLWASLHSDRVFRTDPLTFAKIGTEWLADLTLGGFGGSNRGKALLDTAPLRQLLCTVIDFGAIGQNLQMHLLRGLALSATSYDRGLGVTFFDAVDSVPPWDRRTRIGVRTTLTMEHVLASAAIPIFFPAVQISGEWFGDGCLRMDTPLSPAIHLGADRIVAIGVRGPVKPAPQGPQPYPSKARIAGLILDALFMDSLDADVERADRTNRMVDLLGPEASARAGLRKVPVLALQPSLDLGTVGRNALGHVPPVLRHLLGGLGADEDEGWDLVSYLAFEPDYLEPLLELGYADTLARRDEILRFIGG